MISDYPYHIIHKNHVNGLPTNCLYFDTETKTKDIGEYVAHRMRLAWTCSTRYGSKDDQPREKYRYWQSTKLMWDYIFSLARPKTTLTLFGHNVFFDLQVSDFFYYAKKLNWTLEFVWEKGLTYILIIKKDKQKIVILSSTNYFKASLEELGEILGYPKGKVDFDSVNTKELSEYCRRDVEILKKIMEFYFQFILENDLGKFSYTVPAQAFRGFRHRFMHEKLCVHKDVNVKVLERASYMGGRVEAFSWREQKQGPFVTLDVNSMYPFVMKKFPMPIQLIDYKINPTLEKTKLMLKEYCVVAEVDLKTNLPIYAVRSKGKLIFPIGRFITYLTTEGLKEAIKRHHIKKVFKLAIYKKAMLFGPYVDFFYPLKDRYRNEGNEIFATMAKLFLNSLYGKFGQKKIEEINEIDNSSKTYWKEKIFDLDRTQWVNEVHMLGRVITKRGEGEASHSMVAIASHITEAARLYLWHLIETVGYEKTLYVDTDSLKIRMSDIDLLKSLLDDNKLGALGVKEKSNQLDIMGAKSYKTEIELKMKGVPKKAKKVDKYKYEYYTFFNQSTHLNKGIERYYLTRKTIKNVTPKYLKGTITKKGKIIPFRLESPYQPLSQLPEPFSFYSNLQERSVAGS